MRELHLFWYGGEGLSEQLKLDRQIGGLEERLWQYPYCICWIVAYRAWGYLGLRICRIALCG